MKRIWTTCVLAALSAYIGGCSSGGSAILAGAPGAEAPAYSTVRDAGRITLYKVTEWNSQDQPIHSQEVASYKLQAGEKVGFDWVRDPAHQYDPNAHMNLVAYAGTHRVDLGGINSPKERYFWADPNGWSAYWGAGQGKEMSRRLALITSDKS